MKVLVCEDDKITLKALEYSLRREGYDVFAAADGKEGADFLRRNINDIGILITDQHMPFFSGLELVHILRNELRKDVPIIMLTRISIDEIRKLAISMGVNEYITKPFFPRQLVKKIRCMLKSNQ
jgi:DNA-binding response OmpR family regulator